MDAKSSKRNPITQEVLKAKFFYDPDDGKFIWRAPRQPNLTGKEAGHLTDGYRMLCIDGHYMSAHRLVFLYLFGRTPEGQVDHINGVRHDNRFSNLRVVDQSTNQRNQRIALNNKSGVIGVCWCPRIGKWESSMRIFGKLKVFCRTGDFFEACSARKSAEIKHGFHENHGRTSNV